MNKEEMNKKMSQVIAKAWSDEKFKAKLLAKTAETLQSVPAGLKVTAVHQ